MTRVRLASTRSPYTRAGINIGSPQGPTILELAELTEEQFGKLHGDPNVEIAIEREDGSWTRVQRGELDLAPEAGTVLTGDRQINPTPRPGIVAPVAPLPPVPAGEDDDLLSITGEALPPRGVVQVVPPIDGSMAAAPAAAAIEARPADSAIDGVGGTTVVHVSEPEAEKTIPVAAPADPVPTGAPVGLERPAPKRRSAK